MSGAIRDRPEFVGWLNDARHGHADVLLAWHVDRMTREGLNVAAMILDVVEGKDPVTGKVIYPAVRLMDTTGLDSANGEGFRILFVIRAEIARAERERIKDRAKSRVDRVRSAGRWPGGQTPYGYRVVDAPDGAGKTLAPDPTEAALLRAVIERALAGQSLHRLSVWLNEQGHPSKRGGQWYRSTLVQMLTGDQIAGRITKDGQVLRDVSGRPVQAFEPIATPSELAALRQVIAVNETPKSYGRHPSRLLSGVITCAGCGTRLTVQHAGKYVYYRCNRQSTGATCPEPSLVTAARVEEIIVDEFLSTAGHLPCIERRVVVPDNDGLTLVEDALAATLVELGTTPPPRTSPSSSNYRPTARTSWPSPSRRISK